MWYSMDNQIFKEVMNVTFQVYHDTKHRAGVAFIIGGGCR